MRIAIANVYVGNKKLPAFRKRLIATKAPILALSEAQRVGKIAGYRRFSAPAGEDRFARETALYARNNVKVKGHIWRTVTDNVGGYSHERTIGMLFVDAKDGKWAPIIVHANPTRKGKGKDENIKLIREVYELALYAMSEGYTPLPVGDFNRRASERGEHTPFFLARLLRGVLRLAKVDGIVVPEGAKLVAFRNRGRPPGSDHPLVVVNVKKV